MNIQLLAMNCKVFDVLYSLIEQAFIFVSRLLLLSRLMRRVDFTTVKVFVHICPLLMNPIRQLVVFLFVGLSRQLGNNAMRVQVVRS